MIAETKTSLEDRNWSPCGPMKLITYRHLPWDPAKSDDPLWERSMERPHPMRCALNASCTESSKRIQCFLSRRLLFTACWRVKGILCNLLRQIVQGNPSRSPRAFQVAPKSTPPKARFTEKSINEATKSHEKKTSQKASKSQSEPHGIPWYSMLSPVKNSILVRGSCEPSDVLAIFHGFSWSPRWSHRATRAFARRLGRSSGSSAASGCRFPGHPGEIQWNGRDNKQLWVVMSCFYSMTKCWIL